MDTELSQALSRLNSRAAQRLWRAAELSEGRGDGYLGIEHLAIALLEDPDVAALVVRADQDLEVVRQTVAETLSTRFRLPGGDGLPCTPRLFALLSTSAPRIAERRGDALVAPSHLFGALLQEEGTPLVQALLTRGIDVQRIVRPIETPVDPALEIPQSLSRWCYDLTARAEQGYLWPLVGRESEVQALVRILLSPDGLDASNPVLIGEPGVGKTAIVHGLAQRIVRDEIPRPLRRVRIVEVDLNAVLAGSVYRGSFEEKLQQTIEFAKARHNRARVVLFIDEVHQIVGAGRAEGVLTDAAAILLRPLGAGEIRIIGATTTAQYLEHLVTGRGAIGRRFVEVWVEEPDPLETRAVLLGIRGYLERKLRDHEMEVRITDQAIDAAVEFATRYLRSQRCPAKPRRWLIEAAKNCAIEGRTEVTQEDVAAVVANTTKIPQDVIFRQPRWTPEVWEAALRREVRGQDEAVRTLTYAVLLALSPLRPGNRRRPLGVFLFAGPTGVGKTELAKALCRLMFKNEARLTRLDMSEFVGPRAVDKLIGPPRGVPGEGRGELTDRVRAQPYSIVLLDEFEKADPEVRRLFLQVFDEGWLADGTGEKVYFQDTVLILTSNIGAKEYEELLKRYGQDVVGFPASKNDAEDESRFCRDVRKAFAEAVRTALSPELANRMTAICFFSPLTKETLKEIARLWFDQLADRFRGIGKTLVWEEGVLESLVEQSFDRRNGARGVLRAFEGFVAEELAPRLHQGSLFLVSVRPGGGGQLVVEVDPRAETTGVGTGGTP